MSDDSDQPSKLQAGKVWLIGAGPGAADLITVRGARCSVKQMLFYMTP